VLGVGRTSNIDSAMFEVDESCKEGDVGGSSSKCVELVLGVNVTYLSSSDRFSVAEFRVAKNEVFDVI
jgi:hypothetical protein